MVTLRRKRLICMNFLGRTLRTSERRSRKNTPARKCAHSRIRLFATTKFEQIGRRARRGAPLWGSPLLVVSFEAQANGARTRATGHRGKIAGGCGRLESGRRFASESGERTRIRYRHARVQICLLGFGKSRNRRC